MALAHGGLESKEAAAFLQRVRTLSHTGTGCDLPGTVPGCAKGVGPRGPDWVPDACLSALWAQAEEREQQSRTEEAGTSVCHTCT